MANSSPEEEREKLLRQIFSDVTEGYTETSHLEKPIYIKHFDHRDQVELDSYYQETFNRAKSQGLPTTQEAFDFIRQEELWNKDDDKGLREAHMFLEGVRQRRKSLIIPSQIIEAEKEIGKAQKEVNIWEKKKSDLLHDTCETYSEAKLNDYSIWILFYKDKLLKERFFNWEEFSELGKGELGAFVGTYMTASEHLNIGTLKSVALAPFFMNYFNLLGKDNAHLFFEKPVYKLSFHQVTLLSYAKVFRSILENVDNIPEEIRSNPDALIEYAESSRKSEKYKQRAQDKDGYSVVGAKQKDLRAMGLANDDTVQLSDLARQKGGTLGVEDFMQD